MLLPFVVVLATVLIVAGFKCPPLAYVGVGMMALTLLLVPSPPCHPAVAAPGPVAATAPDPEYDDPRPTPIVLGTNVNSHSMTLPERPRRSTSAAERARQRMSRRMNELAEDRTNFDDAAGRAALQHQLRMVNVRDDPNTVTILPASMRAAARSDNNIDMWNYEPDDALIMGNRRMGELGGFFDGW